MSSPGESSGQQASLQQAAEIIAGADALLIGAGAGMGIESGLPDFRGPNGFWKAYPALGALGLSFIDVASPQTFQRDPALAWGFYGHRLQLYRDTVPHEGFAILRRWADERLLGGRVITSNVDGQFQKAGFTLAQVHEIHGSIHHLQCSRPCGGQLWPAQDFRPEVDAATCRLTNALPRCPHCGAVARPNILMFGDWAWHPQRADLQRDDERAWLANVAHAMGHVAVVELGAGTKIPSIRNFSHQMVREFGAVLVRINLREPEVPGRKHVGLAMGALEGLRGIDAALQARG